MKNVKEKERENQRGLEEGKVRRRRIKEEEGNEERVLTFLKHIQLPTL